MRVWVGFGAAINPSLGDWWFNAGPVARYYYGCEDIAGNQGEGVTRDSIRGNDFDVPSQKVLGLHSNHPEHQNAATELTSQAPDKAIT